MTTITMVFPGQGSQYIGMGKSLAEDHSLKQLFHCADIALDRSLSNLCWEGPEEELTLTYNTQPAIVTHSMALFEKFKASCPALMPRVKRVLGHSVGEYSALCAAGVLSFENTVKAVNMRGRFMQECAPDGGMMMAILRVPNEIVAKACSEVSTPTSQVSAANFNEPEQTVISGHKEACEKAVEWLQNNVEGRMRAVPLKVSAPFHSPLMSEATKQMKEYLQTLQFAPNTIPYIANIDATEYAQGTSGETICHNLVQQIEGSVLWTQSIKAIEEDTLFIEVGPGKVLQGLIKKIRPGAEVISLDDEKAWAELAQKV